MSEKVRFFLEQSVAELEDLQKKEIFTRQEISIIMRRRTDFENRINGRTAKSRDFLKYAEYEMNVEALRKKRAHRLGKANDPKGGVSTWAGPRRIMFIFDRATRKFAGDIPLWLQYLEYAKSQKSVHVITKVFTRMLQLHPAKPRIWIMAAKYEVDVNASMKAARSIMQRGLRFNPESADMWLEYVKLELLYVSKILARRKLLGIQTEKEQEADKNTEEGGAIGLPELTAKDLIAADLKSLPDTDMSVLGTPESNPALRGDVALIIFDSAVEALSKQENFTDQKLYYFSIRVLELIDQFPDVDRHHLCAHVVRYLLDKQPGSLDAKMLDITLPLRHVSHGVAEFPDMLKLTIKKFNGTKQTPELKQLFRDQVISKYLSMPDLEKNIELVLRSLDKKL
ncbi:U3 small nucleolar RNA-associated protein 6 [Trichomonascus vanleenenianus]|uniref:snoRNA-binding rRNA-processing protein UTP6 n=1 Tax=Trichomonascus vanleenenianus TaxID=2268995 RepID=UPI003EC95605